MDNDALFVDIVLTKSCPFCCTGSLITQIVQCSCRNIFACGIVSAVDVNGSICLTPRLYKHLTVLGEFIISIVIAFFAIIISFSGLGTCCTIDAPDITGTKDVTVSLGNTLGSTNLTAIDVYLGLSEDKSL